MFLIRFSMILSVPHCQKALWWYQRFLVHNTDTLLLRYCRFNSSWPSIQPLPSKHSYFHLPNPSCYSRYSTHSSKKSLPVSPWQTFAIASCAGYDPKENGYLVREPILRWACKMQRKSGHWWQFGGRSYGSRACRGRYRTIDWIKS